MIFKVKNKRQKKSLFKTSQGHLVLGEDETVEITDKRLADELRRYQGIEVEEAEPVKVKVPEIQEEREIDYSGYRIQELRSIASQRGIKNFFTMKKSQVIEALKCI